MAAAAKVPFASAHRRHRGYLAALIHRLSGLALVIFLPFHFLALGLSFDEARFSTFIAWSANPIVKLSEWALVSALAVHLFGGIRLLLLEFLGWGVTTALWIGAALAGGVGVGLAFALQAFG